MLPAILHDAHQPLLQPGLTGLLAARADGQADQGLDILWQKDWPSQGDQLVIPGRLTGMGFAAAGFGAGEHHPAATEAFWRRIELIHQAHEVAHQQLQHPATAQQAVVGLQQVQRSLLKGTFGRADVGLATHTPPFSGAGWLAGPSINRCNWASSRWRHSGVSLS